MGLGTVYYQKRRHSRAIVETRCSILLFVEDLVQEIKNGKKYEIIILMIQSNKDINKLKEASYSC